MEMEVREFRQRVRLKGGVAGYGLEQGHLLLRFKESKEGDLILCRLGWWLDRRWRWSHGGGFLSDGGGHHVGNGVGLPIMTPSGTLRGRDNLKYPQPGR